MEKGIGGINGDGGKKKMMTLVACKILNSFLKQEEKKIKCSL